MKTLTLKTLLTIELHTLVLPTLTQLQITASKLFTWFNNNHVKANPEKSHLLLSSKTLKKAYFGGALVESSSSEELFGIQIDSDLTFDEPISSICNNVGKNECTQPPC